MRVIPVLKVLRVAVGALFLSLLLVVPALACPVCDTSTGQQVRQGIFDNRFGVNLLLTLLPFPIFVGIAAALYHGFPGGQQRTSPPPGDP
jgi:hypothetical protein